MKVEHIRGDRKGIFRAIVDDGTQAGLVSYVDAEPNRMIIDHTEVAKIYEGRGIGKQLIIALVEHARANNLKVIPVCSFAQALFDRVQTIRDVLAK